MGNITKWIKTGRRWIVVVAGFIGFVALYGLKKFRQGKALGQAEGEADAAKERIEEDRRDVEKAVETRDGGELFRRARKWTEKK